MVQWHRGSAVLSLVLLLSGLAGCLGGEDLSAAQKAPDDEAGETDGSGADVPDAGPDVPDVPDVPTGGNKKKLTEVGEGQAVFAPSWEAGYWWRFVAGGQMHPPANPTFAVMEVAEDHYKLGADDEVELAFSQLHNGPFIPRANAGIQFDSLGLFFNDQYQDYIGFTQAVDASWEFELFDEKYTLTKRAVGDVETPDGPARGIVVNGTSTADRLLEIEYAANVKWLTLFRVTNPDGSLFMEYVLEDFGQGGGPDVVRWNRIGGSFLNAQSPFYMVDASTWDSDGSGDRVVVYQHLQSALPDVGESTAVAVRPDGEVVAENTVTLGAQWFYTFTEDVDGLWGEHVRALGGDGGDERAKADQWIHQFAIVS